METELLDHAVEYHTPAAGDHFNDFELPDHRDHF